MTAGNLSFHFFLQLSLKKRKIFNGRQILLIFISSKLKILEIHIYCSVMLCFCLRTKHEKRYYYLLGKFSLC